MENESELDREKMKTKKMERDREIGCFFGQEIFFFKKGRKKEKTDRQQTINQTNHSAFYVLIANSFRSSLQFAQFYVHEKNGSSCTSRIGFDIFQHRHNDRKTMDWPDSSAFYLFITCGLSFGPQFE